MDKGGKITCMESWKLTSKALKFSQHQDSGLQLVSAELIVLMREFQGSGLRQTPNMSVFTHGKLGWLDLGSGVWTKFEFEHTCISGYFADSVCMWKVLVFFFFPFCFRGLKFRSFDLLKMPLKPPNLPLKIWESGLTN